MKEITAKTLKIIQVLKLFISIKETQTRLSVLNYTNEMQVKQLLSSVNVRKSCGFDMISPKFIKESTDPVVKPITNILNASITQSCYPNAWKN